MKHLSQATRMSVGIVACCVFIGSNLWHRASLGADEPPVAPVKNGAAESQEKTTATQASDLQKGEPILAVANAAVDAPRRREAGDPWIELLELRQEQHSNYVLKYRVAEGTPERFSVVVKGPRGRVAAEVRGQFLSVVPQFMSGGGIFNPQIRNVDSAGSKEIDIPSIGELAEIWMELDAPSPSPLSPSSHLRPAGRKISHSLMLGSIGLKTFAREWTAAEIKQLEIERLQKAPPPPPPEGFTVIDAATRHLTPGMPILAVDLGAWRKAELLGVGKATIATRWVDERLGKSQQVLPFDRCAVSSEVLKQGETAPGSFKPTFRVFPTTGHFMMNGYELVTDATKLVPGTPLKSASGSSSTLAWIAPDGKLVARDDYQPATKIIGSANEFAIRSKDLQRLQQPDAEAHFRSHLDQMLDLADREAELREQIDSFRKKIQAADNPAGVLKMEPLPEGFVSVPEKTLIPDGLPVLGRTGLGSREWRTGAVSGDSLTARVDVNWKGKDYPHESRIDRRDLFFSKTAEDELRNTPNGAGSNEVFEFDFVVETSKPNHKLRDVLIEEFAMKAAEVADVSRSPGRLEASVQMTRWNARLAQYRLLAAGAEVTIQEKAIAAP